MITTKGIIEAVNIESGVVQYKVRMPLFHELKRYSNTTTRDLPTGIYALPPHMEKTTLRVGDVVLCSLENGGLDSVVILGLLPSSSIKDTAGSMETISKINVEQINSASFDPKGTAVLPVDTKIKIDQNPLLIDGTNYVTRNYVTGEEIACLKGVTTPIGEVLTDLTDTVDKLKTILLSPEAKIEKISTTTATITDLEINEAVFFQNSGVSENSIGDTVKFVYNHADQHWTVVTTLSSLDIQPKREIIPLEKRGSLYIELRQKYGITYSQVDAGFAFKVVVRTKPLPIEYGGTGASKVEEFLESWTIDSTTTTTPTGDLSGKEFTGSVTRGIIDLPAIEDGKCITVEAKSEKDPKYADVMEMSKYHPTPGDQAQALSYTNAIDTTGEVSFSYAPDTSSYTYLFRLEDHNQLSELYGIYRSIAYRAANHACYLAQNENLGYNFFMNNSEAFDAYIFNPANFGKRAFKNITSAADLNCINLIRICFGAVMIGNTEIPERYRTGLDEIFKTNWTCVRIINNDFLRPAGFRRYTDKAWVTNPKNYEIGDILMRYDASHGYGHAALVVQPGTASWTLKYKNGIVDFNPKKGEFLT